MVRSRQLDQPLNKEAPILRMIHPNFLPSLVGFPELSGIEQGNAVIKTQLFVARQVKGNESSEIDAGKWLFGNAARQRRYQASLGSHDWRVSGQSWAVCLKALCWQLAGQQGGQIRSAASVAPFIVIPRNHLDHVLDHQSVHGAENRRKGTSLQVRGNKRLVGHRQNA